MISKEMEQGEERKTSWDGSVIASNIKSKQGLSENWHSYLYKNRRVFVKLLYVDLVLFLKFPCCCSSVQLFAGAPTWVWMTMGLGMAPWGSVQVTFLFVHHYVKVMQVLYTDISSALHWDLSKGNHSDSFCICPWIIRFWLSIIMKLRRQFWSCSDKAADRGLWDEVLEHMLWKEQTFLVRSVLCWKALKHRMLCMPNFAMIECLKLVITTSKTISRELATIKEWAGTNLLADVPQWKHLSSRSC